MNHCQSLYCPDSAFFGQAECSQMEQGYNKEPLYLDFL